MSIKNNKVREALKSIPSIDEILNYFNSSSLPVAFAKFHINKTLKKIRTDFKNELFIDNPKSHIEDTFQILFNKINRKSLRPVINGTGIILHTGLGRSPLSKTLVKNAVENITPYSNLELDLTSGKRGERNKHVEPLINSLTGSEAAIVVNNNAAAV